MTTDPSNIEPFSTPGTASAEDGHVVLDGPDGLALTLTADAAVLLGERLIAAGEKARLQGNEHD